MSATVSAIAQPVTSTENIIKAESLGQGTLALALHETSSKYLQHIFCDVVMS
jgi:hypothetical protein